MTASQEAAATAISRPGPGTTVPEVGPGAQSPDNLVRRALQVIPVVVFLGVLAGIVKYTARPLTNFDTYFHLRIGQEFLDGWSLRDPGSLSTFSTADWLPTQWASQMLMATTERQLGLAGVAWLSGVWFVLLAVALYVSARRQASALAAATLTTLAVVAMQPALSARPQVLSYALVVVFVSTWLASIDDGRPRWWLVPLTWVWAVVHGMWPLAVVIGVAGVLGAALERRHEAGVLARLAAVPLLCGVAAALTPIGPALYGAVVNVGGNARFFSEWGSPDFHHPMAYLPAAMVGATALLWLRRGPTPWSQLAFLALGAAFTLYSIRTLPVAVAIMTPLLAAALAPYLAPQPVRRWERLTVAGGALAAVACLAALVPQTTTPDEDGLANVAGELSSLPDGTPVLNAWEWGGYLMWDQPRLDLVMHGYGDMFTTDELQRNTDIEGLAPDWEDLVAETGARVAVLRSEGKLAHALTQGYDWEVVAEDEVAVMLRAPEDWPASIDD